VSRLGRPKCTVHSPGPRTLSFKTNTGGREGAEGRRRSGEPRRRSGRSWGSGTGGIDRAPSGGSTRTRGFTGGGRTEPSPSSPAGSPSGRRRTRRSRGQSSKVRGWGGSRRYPKFTGGLGLAGGGRERGGGREGRAAELSSGSSPEASVLRLRLPEEAWEEGELVDELREGRELLK
jgi:hypothetical protein